MVSVSSAFNQDMPSQSMANSSPADSYYAVSVQKDIPANVATLNSWRNIDESSSDDEDEVLWTGNEFDSDDDFILVPHVSATAKLSSTAHYDEVTRDVVQGIGHLSFSQSDGECTSAATEPQNKAVQTKVSKGGRSRGNRLSEKPPKPPFSSIAPSRAVTAPAQQSEQANTGTKKFRRKRSGRKRLAAKKTVEKVKESGSSSAAYQGTTHADRLKPRGAERRFGSPLLAELDTEVNSFAQYEGAASFITSYVRRVFACNMMFICIEIGFSRHPTPHNIHVLHSFNHS